MNIRFIFDNLNKGAKRLSFINPHVVEIMILFNEQIR